MLYTLVLVFLILWLLGVVTAYTMGGLIHILLVVAVVMVPLATMLETTAVTPVGAPVTLKLTVPLKPPPRVSVAVVMSCPPCWAEPLEGFTESVMVPGLVLSVPPELQAAKTSAPRSASPSRRKVVVLLGISPLGRAYRKEGA